MRLEHVILGLLALRPLSGYDMRKWMDGPGKYLGYGVQLPQIYRVLPRLVANGWAEFEVDPRDGKPDAKVYRLTDAGRDELLAWARSPYEPSPRPMDPDFRLRFLFAGQLGPEVTVEILRTELDYRLARLREPGWMDFTTIPLDPVPEIDLAWARAIQLSAHEFGYSSTAAYIAWLQLTLAKAEDAAGRAPSSAPYRGRAAMAEQGGS
ncbi:PadR family transcriptional regulator [Streptomyces sp. NPDC002122]|uniref:PadR family transcriptional regulator n=1 Tax=Streptomyces sp. NPDC002122 TaxID=3154407 RepID=UPI00331D605D